MKRTLPLLTYILLLFSFSAKAQYSGTGTFGKITSIDDLTSGTYYVLYGINKTYTGALGNSFASDGRIVATDVTITNNSLSNPAASIVWKIDGNATNGYTLYNEDAKVYCEITGNSTSSFSLEASSLNGYNVAYDETKGFKLLTKNPEGSNRGISIYQTDFRPYATTNTLHLYKLGHVTPPPTGTLELTTPNGGESYNAGQQVQFAWNSTDISSVYFEILGDGGSWEPITGNISSTDGANTHNFTIPANAWGWDQYKLRVVDALAPSINDESDAVFTVVGHNVELLSENFSSGTLGSFEQVSISGTNTWMPDQNTGVTYAKMTGFNNGINEDWLLSSAINLDNSTNEILEFKTACYYTGDDVTVKYATNYNGQGDPSTATWMEFPSYTLSSGNWAWTHSGYIDLNTITGTIHIAFVFTCSETESKTWEITDIYVSGVNDSSTNLDSKTTSDIVISPNPFSSELQVKSVKDVQHIILFNTTGQVVKNELSGNKRVNTTNLPKGMYIIQVRFTDGSTTTQKVIKK